MTDMNSLPTWRDRVRQTDKHHFHTLRSLFRHHPLFAARIVCDILLPAAGAVVAVLFLRTAWACRMRKRASRRRHFKRTRGCVTISTAYRSDCLPTTTHLPAVWTCDAFWQRTRT